MTAETEWYEVSDGEWYVIGDAQAVLSEYESEAAAVFFDDAWARPERRQQSGLEYILHPFDDEQSVSGAGTDDSLTTTDLIDASRDALVEGGWLIADVDDWLLPRLLDYLRAEWGDVTAEHGGGGYRKIGGVTYLDGGAPDRETHGSHLSTGGYPVVFAHRGETERTTAVSARQVATWPEREYGGGRVKAIEPYESWVEGLVEPGELILVPCAGTAPAALAAKRVFGADARYVCIDTEPAAYDAFIDRYRQEWPSA